MRRNLVAFLSCLALFHGFFAAGMGQENFSNKAARIRIIKSVLETELAGREAPEGKAYLVLQTEWENIHPKQKVKKSDLEGKPDRTMGVGGLLGNKKETKEEYVEADVTYLVPNLFDHIYCLADGQSIALDGMTKEVPGGIDPQKGFSMAKLGEKELLSLVFLVPDRAKNLAFQLFDYSYGHILVPIRGELGAAVGKEVPPGTVLGSIKDEKIEMAATAIHFQNKYKEEEAPEGWRYSVVEINGKSLSRSAAMRDIIQIEPQENIWLMTKEGYLYYSCGGSTTEDGYLRFTPEFSQSQQVAFLVPSSIKDYALGIRIQNRTYTLTLSPNFQIETPGATASHRDGQIMEVFLYGMRKEENSVILDLGIKSSATSGVEIQMDQQFILKGGEEDVSPDETATQALLHRPPTPFIIPPRVFVRFELAYLSEGRPTSLFYRGYRSESHFDLTKLR